MKKILAIGYIPKQYGGKQTSGLSTGIFDLHDAVNTLKTDYRVIIAATDIHEDEIIVNTTTVIGWNRIFLLKHIIKYPLRLFYFVYRTFYLFLRFWKLVPFFNTLAKAIFLDYAVERIKPDLVHFHGTSGAILSYCLWNKKQDRLLRIHGVNGFDSSIPNFYIHRKIEDFITSFHFIRVTFVTQGIIEEWKGKYGTFNCEMISVLNGYNSSYFYPPLNNIEKTQDLITISSLYERKGQVRVIEALIKLKREGVNLSYLIIGYGSLEEKKKINTLITNNNLKVTVIDYLHQDKLANYLHQSKYFILPSISEGFGKVYIESIGSGTPVIIPRHLPLAVNEKVLNSVNSIQIEDSTIDSIYLGLKRLLKSLPVKNSAIEVSKTVENLQWSQIAIEYTKLYRSIFSL